MPHPRAQEHPIPSCAYLCSNTECAEELLVCIGCQDTGPDWWWSLGTTWTCWYICEEHQTSYCQGCYFQSLCWKHSEEFPSDDEEDTLGIPSPSGSGSEEE